jgi:hypothetical protein
LSMMNNFLIGSALESQKNLSYNIWNKLHFEFFLEFLRGLNLWGKFWEIH